MLGGSTVWTRQPQFPAPLNYAHPFLAAMKADFAYSGNVQRLTPQNGGVILGPTQRGIVTATDGSTSASAAPNTSAAYTSNVANPYTLALVFVPNSADTTRAIFYTNSSATDTAVAGTIRVGIGQNGTAVTAYFRRAIRITSGAVTDGALTCAILTSPTHSPTFYLNGTNVGTYANTESAGTHIHVGGGDAGGALSGVLLAVAGKMNLTDAAALYWSKELQRNPWQLYQPLPRRVFAVVAGGAVTHATDGALTGPGSTIAGTAAHIAKHATSGALTGQGAVVAGTSAHIAKHATSGVLTGQGAVVAGVSERVGGAVSHATSGALTGQGATLAGTAAHVAVHATSGVLVGQGAEITGIASSPAAAAAESFSGGWLSLPDYTRGRDEYVRRQRIALGILPPEQIAQAAVIPEAVAESAKVVALRTRGVRMSAAQREADLRAEVERTQAWEDDYAAALYAELYRIEKQRREDDLIVALLAA